MSNRVINWVVAVSLSSMLVACGQGGGTAVSENPDEIGIGASCNDCGGYQSAGNPFPCCDNGGNCTWWIWYKANSVWGEATTPSLRNAMYWAKDAMLKSSKYWVSTVPAPQTIAVSTQGPYGHVAWVEEVYSDGTILVSEMMCLPGRRSDRNGAMWNRYRVEHFDGGFIYSKSYHSPSPTESLSQQSNIGPAPLPASGPTPIFTAPISGSPPPHN